jgi:hypothetical protein
MKQFLTSRIEECINAVHLTFSCYRIRRRWALPLPVSALPKLDLQVRGFSQPYPWQIWCLWALEERLHTLACAAELDSNQAAFSKCVVDLEALADWPCYTVAGKLGLPYGHAVQLMAVALLDWHWLPESTRIKLRRSLRRAIDEALPLVPAAVRDLPSAATVLAMPSPHQHLHNISLIAQAALATAAEAVGHAERSALSSRFQHLFQARLELFYKGVTEGISYDGYLYNFGLGWLKTQPFEVIQSVVRHPAMLDLETQALGLGCPCNVSLSAEIGDTEPMEMPFIWSALARLQQFGYSESRAGLIAAVAPNRLRADALWALALSAPGQVGVSSCLSLQAVPPTQQSSFALTLASGLGNDDLSVVIALCTSPMNHVQADNGTLLIGHASHWWITDPGYQQYLKTSEREFTLGQVAHNTPVVNGYGQSRKAAKLLDSGEFLSKLQENGAYAVLDLSSCYPAEAGVESVVRTVWRLGRDQVVVCDAVETIPEALVAYHWHGDAEAFWGELDGAVSLTLEDSNRTMWIQSGQQALNLSQQHRLRGSRGQCSLRVVQAAGILYHWWGFTFSDRAPVFKVVGSNAFIRNFDLKACNAPLRVYADCNTGQVTGRCVLLPGALKGDVEYAFYLLVAGQKAQVRWYEAADTHAFTLLPTDIGKAIQVRGFVREVAAPEQKLSAVSRAL